MKLKECFPQKSVKLWGCEAENEAQMLGEGDRGGEERRREGIPKWLRVLVGGTQEYH